MVVPADHHKLLVAAVCLCVYVCVGWLLGANCNSFHLLH